MTTHERRMAMLREQIEQLENENVAKKDWVLMGEASSKSRPQDSLLQEDLEFERAAKTVPIITEEVVASLETRIKSRIREGLFDDVVRRRPMDDKPFIPSRFFELQDSKSQQSLAQIYENEYVAAQPGTSTDDRDGKLKKEHDEITKLWESICNKLDALCNAHYVPKQVCDTRTYSYILELTFIRAAESDYINDVRRSRCDTRICPSNWQVVVKYASTRGNICAGFVRSSHTQRAHTCPEAYSTRKGAEDSEEGS